MNPLANQFAGNPGHAAAAVAPEGAEAFLARCKGTPPRIITPGQVAAAVRQLPALPRAVANLLALFRSAETSVAEVGNLIGRDPTLTASVLRIANSPWYGMSGRIRNPQEAVMVLGLPAVRNIALTVSLTSAFSAFRTGWFHSDAFWIHSIATAVCARHLAITCVPEVSPELAYCAGLLHDVGEIALATALPLEYEKVLQRRQSGDLALCDAEFPLLGTEHAQVGAALARQWHFDPVLEQAILGHHAPPERDYAGLTDIVHAADLLAHALDIAGDTQEAVERPCEAAWRRLGMKWDDLMLALPQIEEQARHAAAALGLTRELR